jgi:hypothetical protein
LSRTGSCQVLVDIARFHHSGWLQPAEIDVLSEIEHVAFEILTLLSGPLRAMNMVLQSIGEERKRKLTAVVSASSRAVFSAEPGMGTVKGDL